MNKKILFGGIFVMTFFVFFVMLFSIGFFEQNARFARSSIVHSENPSVAIADGYFVTMEKTEYISGDNSVAFTLTFTPRVDFAVTIDITDSNGQFVNSLANSVFQYYSTSTSPSTITVPVELTTLGTYYVTATVIEFDGAIDNTVYTNNAMSFTYEDGSNGGNVSDVYGEIACDSNNCQEGVECAAALSGGEGCLMELIDIIPAVDKYSAVSLLADDVCTLVERTELNDPIGMAVTSGLMALDLSDNALDFLGLPGMVSAAAIDAIEGTVGCAEGLIYDHYLTSCGGYYNCFLGYVIEISKTRGIAASTHVAFSPVNLAVTGPYGGEFSALDGVLTFNMGDMHAVVIFSPERFTDGYDLQATGTGSGTYHIESAVTDWSGNIVKEFSTDSKAVSFGQVDSYFTMIPLSLDSDDIILPEVVDSSSGAGDGGNIDEGYYSGSGWFSDVPPTHWAYNIISDLTGIGVIKGYNDGTFKPEKAITRAEFLKVALETFKDINITTFGESVSAKEESFSDVSSGDWFYEYVSFAAYKGVVNGYSDGTFKPNKEVTRAEALKIAYLATGLDMPLDNPVSNFSDVPVSEWYSYYVTVGVSMGVVNGYSDGTFKPNKSISRAEASKIIKSIYDLTATTMYGTGI